MKVQYFVRVFRLLLYWCLPPVILYIIFSRIDFLRLIDVAAKANPVLMAVALAFIILKILIGAIRWHWLAKYYKCTVIGFWDSVTEYWISITIGIVAPGAIGSDVYRVALGGRQTGFYIRNALVIGIERTEALFSCAVLLVSIYPFLHIQKMPVELIFILKIAYVSLITGIVVVFLAAITHKANWIHNLMNKFSYSVLRLAKKIKSKTVDQRGNDIERISNYSPAELFYLAFKPRLLIPTILLSIFIHAAGAIQSQLFFQALGYDLPFSVNLFLGPLILLTLTLPISFGGIGVREGIFFLFYGAFGVPAEIALVVSYCSLCSVLIGHAIGSILIFSRRKRNGNIQETLQESK